MSQRSPRADNALKHGLFAASPVMPDEDPFEYEEFRQRMAADIAPIGVQQQVLAQRIIDLSWRLARIPTLEAKVSDWGPFDMIKYLNLLSVYEGRLERQVQALYKTLHELKALAEKTNLPRILVEKRDARGQWPPRHPAPPGQPRVTIHAEGVKNATDPKLSELLKGAQAELAKLVAAQKAP